MFQKTAKYIVLSRHVVFLINPNSKNIVESLKYVENEGELKIVVRRIKEFASSKKVGLIIADDLIYVFSSKMRVVDESGKPVDEKPLIEDKIKSKIPEDLSDVVWDFKSKQIDTEYKLFQIAVTTPFTADFVSLLAKNTIELDFVEPFSYTLARNTMGHNSLHLIVSSNPFENCIVVADGGYVHYASTFRKDNFSSEFEKVLNYTYGKYKYADYQGKKVKIYLTEKDIQDLRIKIPDYLADKYELKVFSFNVFDDQLSESKAHWGKDEDVLNVVEKKAGSNYFLKILPNLVPKASSEATSGGKPESKSKLFVMIGVLVILIASVVYVLMTRANEPIATNSELANIEGKPAEAVNATAENNENQEKQAETPSNAQDDSIVEQKTEDSQDDPETGIVQDLTLWKLLILNGSGYPGDASRINDLFKNSGFSDGELGNYPSGTTKQTIIRTKASLPTDVSTQIAWVLKDFDLSFSREFLEETSPYDIEVVVGETRQE